MRAQNPKPLAGLFLAQHRQGDDLILEYRIEFFAAALGLYILEALGLGHFPDPVHGQALGLGIIQKIHVAVAQGEDFLALPVRS